MVPLRRQGKNLYTPDLTALDGFDWPVAHL